MQRPKVGVGVCIKKQGKVLLGRRQNSHGHDTWSFPGGHLEYSESPVDTAIRETEEETGITLKDVSLLDVYTNDIFTKEEKHYITLYVMAETEQEPELLEPEKCLEWRWFSWDDLPENLFLPLQNLKKQGFRP